MEFHIYYNEGSKAVVYADNLFEAIAQSPIKRTISHVESIEVDFYSDCELDKED